MSWIAGVQRAIDYIEENITQELDYEEVARQASSSSFHFQRVFGILCTCTIGEYIRARRLTLAGMELAASDIRVIDAALKYGYESPESFSRAFVKFHGITPSRAKKPGANLRLFSRLSVKLVMEGGFAMDYRIEERKAFKVIEKVRVFSTKDELHLEEIPAATWAIFKCKGPVPGAIQNLWRRIYTEFFPTSEYLPKNGIDFEVYPEGDLSSPHYESEIRVAVEKPEKPVE